MIFRLTELLRNTVTRKYQIYISRKVTVVSCMPIVDAVLCLSE